MIINLLKEWYGDVAASRVDIFMARDNLPGSSSLSQICTRRFNPGAGNETNLK